MIHEGKSVFINSRVKHRLECDSSTIIPSIEFSPCLLADESSLIYEKYIEPVINSTNECMVFTQKNSVERKIISIMKEIFDLQSEK